MNERIRELAEQAWQYADNNSRGGVVTHRWLYRDKFAELIVKEMCGMMEQTEDDLYAMDPSERPTEYIEWLYYWRTRFEKHFGVEE
jgi:hypothetical protein